MALTIHFATDDQNWPTASIVSKGGKKSRPEPITPDEFVVLSLIVARIFATSKPSEDEGAPAQAVDKP